MTRDVYTPATTQSCSGVAEALGSRTPSVCPRSRSHLFVVARTLCEPFFKTVCCAKRSEKRFVGTVLRSLWGRFASALQTLCERVFFAQRFPFFYYDGFDRTVGENVLRKTNCERFL